MENGVVSYALLKQKSYRTIPLTDKAYKAFLYQKQLQFYLNLHSNVIVDGYSNFVFPTRNGTLNHSQLLDNMFRNLEKSYNTKHPDAPLPHLSCHVFRHTGCALTAKKCLNWESIPSFCNNGWDMHH